MNDHWVDWMPPGGVWRGACEKWGYPNRDVAMRELIATREKRSGTREMERGIVECPTCGDWHLTRRAQSQLENNAPEVRAAIIESRRKMKEYQRRG